MKLAWRAARGWWTTLVLRWIDRYLQRHDQERTFAVLDFEKLEVLYDEADIPALFDEPGGFVANSWLELLESIDYGNSSVLS
jgi:hypothetical protein